MNLWKFGFQDRSGEKPPDEKEIKLEFDIIGVTEDRKKYFAKWGGERLGLLDLGREIDVQRVANMTGMDIPIYREDTSIAVDGTPVTELKLVEIIQPGKEEVQNEIQTGKTSGATPD